MKDSASEDQELLARICEIINPKRFIASLAGLLYNGIMNEETERRKYTWLSVQAAS